jgi:ATP-dependent DNA helicase RecQ
MLCAHFTGTDDHADCGRCDVCTGAGEEVPEAPAPPRAEPPGADARAAILDAVGALDKPVGKVTLAKSLRARLPGAPQAAIVATIEQLLAERRLVRRGRKYPTIWLPGRAIREPKPRSSTASDLKRALDNFRRKKARELNWKSYMVFQRRVILAIDQHRPATMDALARIPGLGPAKLDRFGAELLRLVHAHDR